MHRADHLHPEVAGRQHSDMKNIIGFEDKVKWHSPGPHSMPQRFTDLHAMRLVMHGDLQPRDLNNLWLATFFRHKHRLLVRRCVQWQVVGGWSFALLDVADSAALLCPATELRPQALPDMVFYEPVASVNSLDDCICPVTNLNDIQATLGNQEHRGGLCLSGLV